MPPPVQLRDRIAPPLCGAFVVVWVALHRFVIDDAFISMRYARNAARGLGLVYNEGVWVEGYTNFLWTLALVPAFWLGVDVRTWALALGALSFASVLAVFAWFARRREVAWSTIAVWWVALGTGTMATFATSGMETMAQAALVLGVHVLTLRCLEPGATWSLGSLVAISGLAALALLTRLDSAVLLAPCAAALIAAWARERAFAPRDALALVLPVALVVGGWLSWKHGRYGSVLPHTFAAKTGHGTDVVRGAFYVAYFLGLTLWGAPLALGVVAFARTRHRELALSVATAAAWCAYVAWTGGGFMEFRFMVPVVPILAVLAVVASRAIDLESRLFVTLAAVVVGASLVHQFTYSTTWYIQRLPGLTYDAPRVRVEEWTTIGETLRAQLGEVRDLHISTTAAGALPFYADVRTLDMHGLNEPWVTNHGDEFGPVPGHTHIAPHHYLAERGVHLNLQFPRLHDPDALVGAKLCETMREYFWKPPADIEVLTIGVPDGRVFIATIVTANAAIDAIAARRGWRRQVCH